MNERVTVELDAETLAAAREAGVDLSELLSRALRRHLPKLDAADRELAARQWYEENKRSGRCLQRDDRNAWPIF
jgi:post-segregation antitoxin (ccd killing protein)